jgi:predicted nucleotidyltransferase component of viral defense system
MRWEDVIERSGALGATRKQVLVEEVQKTILTSLSLRGCFEHIVFQGGTALRLFHGNPRFSEDIDLVMVEGAGPFSLGEHMAHVARYVEDALPFLESVVTTPQKDDPLLQRHILRTVSTDRGRVVRVHVELAPVPSHRNDLRILDHPPVLPVVRVEDTVEILADKVCALAFRPYLKGRDLWDIHYLTEERSVEVDGELVVRKAVDYGKTVPGLVEGLERSRGRVREEGLSVLEDEMARFLPSRVREAYRPEFGKVVQRVAGVIAHSLDLVGAADR